MFNWRKKGKQAKRKLPATQSPTFEWKQSYNWIFALIPLCLLVVYVAQMDRILPIQTIQLSGTFENLDQKEVEDTLQVYLGEGFFSLDIHELQERLNAKPWTESVSVRRIWPDKIRVTIVEKKPLARWDDNNLLSTRARVYRADPQAFTHLPLIHASSHQPAWVLTQFERLQSRFHDVGEQLVALRVDSRGAFDVELDSGLKIKLGRSDINRKIDRLVRIYHEQILPRREQIAQLDLRYSNGLAVAWKKEALQERNEASLWSHSNV